MTTETLYPTGDTSPNSWLCSTGSDHYALVDEVGSHDSDTTTLVTGALQFDEIYIGCVIDGTTYNYTLGDISNQTTYTLNSKILTENPDTSLEWTESDINSLLFYFSRYYEGNHTGEEFSLEDLSGNVGDINSITLSLYHKFVSSKVFSTHYVTQCYVVVDYEESGFSKSNYVGRNVRRRIRSFPSGRVVKI